MSPKHRCPFCGSRKLSAEGLAWVACQNCGAEGPYKETWDEALAAFCHPAQTVPADLLRRVLAARCYNGCDENTNVTCMLNRDLLSECRRALGEE